MLGKEDSMIVGTRDLVVRCVRMHYFSNRYLDEASGTTVQSLCEAKDDSSIKEMRLVQRLL